MKIIINAINNENQETIFFENLDNIDELITKLSFIKGPLEVKIFAINESISSHKLLKYKINFEKVNLCSLHIYSNNRDTIIAGKSLKINSTFIKKEEIKNNLLLLDSRNQQDILHK